METTKPLSEYTAAELKEYLKQKEAADQEKQIKRKKAYETDKENFLYEVLNRFTDARAILETLKK